MLRRLFALILILIVFGGGGYGVWRALQVEPPLSRAARLMAAKDVFGAQVVLRGIIKSDPRNVEAHLMLARTQIATSDWLSAEKEAKTLRALGYDRLVVSPMLVRSYAMQGRYQDILSDIPTVASNPGEQYMNLALRSVGFLGMKDVGLAQQLVDAAGVLSPDAYIVHLQKARVALAKKDSGVALREIDRALVDRPTSTEALMVKSEVLAARQDKMGAVEQLSQAVEAAPLAQDIRMLRAGLLLELGQNRAAQADVDAVFSLTPANATALYYNAVLMFRQQQYADANVEFDKLAGQMDQFPRAYYHKAEIALALGNTQSALESLDHFLRLRPGDGEGIRLSAQIQLREAQPDRALAVLSPVTGAGSRDALAIDMQGRAYFMLGRMPEAIDSFRRAVAIAPDNTEYTSHLAAAQTKFGVAPIPGDESIDLPP